MKRLEGINSGIEDCVGMEMMRVDTPPEGLE